jgi:hypothetical protein
VLAVLLFSLADPKGEFIDPDLDDRPLRLPEPPEREAIIREHLVVAREGGSFRFVPRSEYEDSFPSVPANDPRRMVPQWSVYPEQMRDRKESVSCGASYFIPGLIRREARWTYVLKTNRIDRGFYIERRNKWIELRNWGLDWKGDKENPYELPPDQVRRLMQLVVEELNRRHPGTKLGDRLEKMLDDGLEGSSTSYAPQNTLILMRWLALLMVVVGLGSVFVRPRAVSTPPCALPMSQNEVLLIKIAALRERQKKRYKAAC